MWWRFDGYRVERHGSWRTWVQEATWQAGWWRAISERLEGTREPIGRSRHADTSVITLDTRRGGIRGFLKIYRAPGLWQAIKDQVKSPKPLRALKMSRMLVGDGFQAPAVLAVGEQRRYGILIRAFLLTREVSGVGLDRVAKQLAAMEARRRRSFKRQLLVLLGAEVARLHNCGYVHGDLVVTNILLQDGPAAKLWLIDHDRSRRPRSLRLARLQRRNLVQLNRIELDGVSNADRLHAFRSYAAARHWDRQRTRREARWVAGRTRMRRSSIERSLAERVGVGSGADTEGTGGK